MISPHFSLEELTASATASEWGIKNTPNAFQLANLERLCDDLLEPVRDLLKTPLSVSSGFRCPRLNSIVGGEPASYHLDGLAADLTPHGMDLEDAWDAIVASHLPFDQLILETAPSGAVWLHLNVPRDGHEPRRQALHLTKRHQRRQIG